VIGRAEGFSSGRAEGFSSGRAEGFSSGRAESLAQNICSVVNSRGIGLASTDLARIANCRDVGTLQRWFDQALVMRDGEELVP